MRPERLNRKSASMMPADGERGFSLVSAIFLLVALATLAAAMVTFSTTQQATSTQDLLGAQAYQAARAGIEWGLHQLIRTDKCSAGSTIGPLGGNLSGFTVTVTCEGPFTSDEANATVNVYRIKSTASQGTSGTTYYVSRQLQVIAEK
jgi:MSHA biogenesis protein MshP